MSSTQEDLILYDIPTKRTDIASWSPNVWKTRLALNYKQVPYKTVWLKHSAIAPTLSSFGIKPNEPKPVGPPTSPYTLPAVRFPDGTYVMDSAAIAIELENRYPTPSLRLEEETHTEVLKLFGGVAVPLLPTIYSHIASNILLDESAVEWKAKKEKAAGMPFDEYVRANSGQEVWERAGQGIEKLAAYVRGAKRDEGAFILGSRVSYGDFVVAALVESMRRIDGGLFERMMGFDGEGLLRGAHEACEGEGWFGRDD